MHTLASDIPGRGRKDFWSVKVGGKRFEVGEECKMMEEVEMWELWRAWEGGWVGRVIDWEGRW